MSLKNYALLDGSSPQKVTNVVVWDATAEPDLFSNGAYADTTGASPMPSPPWIDTNSEAHHFTYNGSSFTQVDGS